MGFPSLASFFSLCHHIFILFPFRYKGEEKRRRGRKVPLVYETEKLSKVHSRESVLPCIQSLKLSVFKGGAVMGPLHGEITCCSPSLKMLTLSLTSDWEQKHMLCARWLNGSVSALWKRLACICQSSGLALWVYVCTGMCVACAHTYTLAHTFICIYVAFRDLDFCLLENEENWTSFQYFDVYPSLRSFGLLVSTLLNSCIIYLFILNYRKFHLGRI